MSKALIAIVNARHRRAWRDAIRSTWLPMVPADRADAFFFVGRGAQLSSEDKEGIVELNCDDSYMGLPDKIRSIMRWAYERDYSHASKIDDDVVLHPTNFLNSGYTTQQYTGPANRMPTNVAPFWVPMGFAYSVAKEAMVHLINAPLPTEGNDDEKWVAQNLHGAGISLHHDMRYRLQYGQMNNRPLRPPTTRAIRRPLSTDINRDVYPGTFAWCIFLEGNSGETIPTERKIAEFMKTFNERVINVSVESSKN